MNDLTPEPATVRAQLARIVDSADFAGAKRLCAFLSYVVEESLAGRGDLLKGYAIGLEVFERGEDFDPQTDPVVRVEAGRLRRRLREYYLTAGKQDPIHIEIPRGTYDPVISTQSAAVEAPDLAAPAASRPDRGPSIVVLPFQNYGSDPADQFFADGLTEETIANLTRFRDLFVFSRSTTTRLAADGADIGKIHRDLGADFVVEGSVRKSPSAVRVTLQLIDAATDGHIFAEQFDRPSTPDAIFELQDEIAVLVASRVADRHGPLGRYVKRARQAGTTKRWETYLWVTRFYEYYATHDPDLHLQVRDGLTAALAEDTGYADGWAALATVLLDEYRLHLNERPNYPALDYALEHALRAVTCDPENAFAYKTLALVHYHRRDFDDFAIAGDRAIQLNPGHSDVLADIGFCHAVRGDWQRGLPLADRAIELSPVHPGWYRLPRALDKLLTGDPAGAALEMKQAPTIGFHWYHIQVAGFLAAAGAAEEAAAECAAAVAAYPGLGAAARQELETWCVPPDLADLLLGHWRSAGLDVA